MLVRLYTVQPNHGNVMAHCTLKYPGGHITSLSRTHECICGESLKDGDRVYDLPNGAIAHVNCHALMQAWANR